MKSTDSDSANVNSHPETEQGKTEKNTPTTNAVNKDSSQKFPSANFSEIPTPVSDVVFGDNRSDSNLSSGSTKDNSKTSKKRKANSRTPTPNSITQPDPERSASVSTIVSVTQSASVTPNLPTTVTSGTAADRRDSVGSGDSSDKPKKVFTINFLF